jgi:c-di-GMP-binding flagellar brake protein YcgR
METAQRVPISRRRTKRIALTASLEVSGKGAQGAAFSSTTIATNLNRHGATLGLNRDLTVGSIVVVQNNRRTRASARVVAQTNTPTGAYTYGLEFLEADNVKDFWGITFPPPARPH